MTLDKIINEIWRPTLETIILAIGVYYAFKVVRGTRGWPIFIGFVGLMLSLALITIALNLTVLLWILKNFWSVLILAVMIIFQPELRRMLAQLGNIPLLSTVDQQRENIEVIVTAAENLSNARIGALIAIEQNVQLADVVESGIVVDCIATPEMLETIFFPNNAIHDGGVIIKGNRITHAACIFPLTDRADLAKTLGTRHRAAIGLTEETDAVVIVVSEETGLISYAYKGELVRGVTVQELRAFLTSVLVPQARRKSILEWIRSWTIERPVPAVRSGSQKPEQPNHKPEQNNHVEQN